MRAYVYAFQKNGQWIADAAYDWSFIRNFWLEPEFRKGVLAALDKPYGEDGVDKQAVRRMARQAAHQAVASENGGSAELLILRAELPYGQASRACGLWERRSPKTPLSTMEAAAELARCAQLAIGRPVEPAGCGIYSWRGGMKDEHRADAASRTGLFDQGLLMAQLAVELGEAVAGRALLWNELLQLAEARGLLGNSPERLLTLLQLARLLGTVELRPAIVQERRNRKWWRPKRAEALRCTRCGSGMAAMVQTSCASCGSQCYYCEACLGMGRSRECALLVRGKAAGGANSFPAHSGAGRASIAHEAASEYGDGRAAAQAAGQAAAVHAVGPTAVQVAQQAQLVQQGQQAQQGQQDQQVQQAQQAARQGSQQENQQETQQANLAPVNERLAAWSLSPAQYAAARQALQFLESGSGVIDRPLDRSFLLWAVTGAGKTEMMFPLIESVLLRDKRALIATPRRDVVLELDPRLRKAFPAAKVVTLYGGSEERWEAGDITLSTTHQLLRFEKAFDLAVIDELDAFPYHGDPVLHYAADKAVAPGGKKLLLSATPPADLQRAASRGRLGHVRVPVRFHRYPLPVPLLLRTPTVAQMIRQSKIPPQLSRRLRMSIERGAQLFVFVQRISQVEPFAALLRSSYPDLPIEGTSSQDPERTDKVKRFRAAHIRLLVTTTILERGVTVPRSDVFIMDADGQLFDEASLVQMAGRAGRSMDDPRGTAVFCSPVRNRAQVQAVKQITVMNRLAARAGYLRT